MGARAAMLEPLIGGRARGPIAILAAHPDDETLSASLLVRHAPNCRILHLTDGAPRNARWRAGFSGSRTAYAALRARELRSALAVAGLESGRIRSLGGVDLETPYQLATLTRRLVEYLTASPAAVLVTHSYEGGHPDHDSASFVAHAAAALLARGGHPAPTIAEMASYHSRGGRLVCGTFLPRRGDGAQRIPLVGEDLITRDAMLARFESQRQILSIIRRPWECYRLSPGCDPSRQPHAGVLHYESAQFPISGERWRALACLAASSLGLEGVFGTRSSRPSRR